MKFQAKIFIVILTLLVTACGKDEDPFKDSPAGLAVIETAQKGLEEVGCYYNGEQFECIKLDDNVQKARLAEFAEKCEAYERENFVGRSTQLVNKKGRAAREAIRKIEARASRCSTLRPGGFARYDRDCAN